MLDEEVRYLSSNTTRAQDERRVGNQPTSPGSLNKAVTKGSRNDYVHGKVRCTPQHFADVQVRGQNAQPGDNRSCDESAANKTG